MKNQSIILISLLSIGVGLAIGYALWGSADGKYKSQEQTDNTFIPAGTHRMSDGSLMGNESIETETGAVTGMDHGNMTVRSEREFLEGMIPHHQEAVDTANEVLLRGGSTPEIKKLAEDIVTAQEKEIASMKVWYKNWYKKAYTDDGSTYIPMMRNLSSLEGAALDKVFLEDMIMHHTGAIIMAQSVTPYVEHSEISALTKAIVETQAVEIQLMRRLINDL